jgi:N-acetylglutamate synthase-like GNAT family acetyltransferase
VRPDDLRRAVPADTDAIRALVTAAYSKWIPLIGRKPKPMLADYDAAVRVSLFWLLEENGNLTALLELIPHGDHLLVENIAVSPDYQRRNLGSGLMAFAETQARELGLQEMRLYTNERFTGNVKLYSRLGYVETHRQPLEGSDVVFMTKRLE